MLDKYIEEHICLVRTVLDVKNEINIFVESALNAFRNNNKMLIFGNGGSAADAQHMAAELVGRFKKEKRALPALALTTDTSIISSIANDYSYDDVFSRQVDALANDGDILLGISTSGNSSNVSKAVQKGKEKGCTTFALLGCNGGIIKDKADVSIVINSDNVPRVQECHIFIIHIICELIENGIIHDL